MPEVRELMCLYMYMAEINALMHSSVPSLGPFWPSSTAFNCGHTHTHIYALSPAPSGHPAARVSPMIKTKYWQIDQLNLALQLCGSVNFFCLTDLAGEGLCFCVCLCVPDRTVYFLSTLLVVCLKQCLRAIINHNTVSEIYRTFKFRSKLQDKNIKCKSSII